MDSIRNCGSTQENDKRSSIPPCSTAGACFREAVNSARFFQADGSSSTIRWIRSPRWKPKGCRTCSKISRASVLRTTQLSENFSETQEAHMMRRKQGTPDASLCFLVLILVGSVTCARRCLALLRLRTTWGIRTYS